ncbi:MAG: HAD family hydrolase [Chloroflexi bacterium]|nr:HAD family hydrolase [Chloroflexota bacterium]
MTNWMKKLALHYNKTKRLYPQETLMILFDIDGTIVDMRFLIHYVLREFDRLHGTELFGDLQVVDITVHENHVDELLEQLEIPKDQQRHILEFWSDHRWLPDSLMEAHKPFAGVMEIIRWFQIQSNVVVGLNTGRPEYLRADTLRSLNAIGRDFRVSFRSEHLYMNPNEWEQGVARSKADGIRRFQDEGFRVFAMVDNEPANLAAVFELDGCDEILPLHAHTIFESECGDLPYCSASGSDYVLSDLATEDDLPDDVQFVWHGVNDRANLRQFLGSDVEWGEIDVRTDGDTGELILRHDSTAPDQEGEMAPVLKLDEVVQRLIRFEKSIKFDFKEGGHVVDRVIGILKEDGVGLEERRLWFNANVEVLEKEGFERLRQAFPAAIVQCPIDSHIEGLIDAPEDVKRMLSSLSSWGISRFSIEWGSPELFQVLDQLNDWGFETNVYNVPDLDSFLQVVLFKPCSITADFNFPKWHYYGHGSGQDDEYHHYSMEENSSDAA